MLIINKYKVIRSAVGTVRFKMIFVLILFILFNYNLYPVDDFEVIIKEIEKGEGLIIKIDTKINKIKSYGLLHDNFKIDISDFARDISQFVKKIAALKIKFKDLPQTSPVHSIKTTLDSYSKSLIIYETWLGIINDPNNQLTKSGEKMGGIKNSLFQGYTIAYTLVQQNTSNLLFAMTFQRIKKDIKDSLENLKVMFSTVKGIDCKTKKIYQKLEKVDCRTKHIVWELRELKKILTNRKNLVSFAIYPDSNNDSNEQSPILGLGYQRFYEDSNLGWGMEFNLKSDLQYRHGLSVNLSYKFFSTKKWSVLFLGGGNSLLSPGSEGYEWGVHGGVLAYREWGKLGAGLGINYSTLFKLGLKLYFGF